MRDTIARLDAATDSAKKELAQRHRRGPAQAARHLPRQPRRCSAGWCRSGTRCPTCSTTSRSRSKIRGVTLSQVVPLPVEPGPAPFDTYKYNMSVIGHYDQIGQFLADVASLQRIIVPYDLSVDHGQPSGAAKALSDTSGSLLEAKFQVRTYVKSASAEGEASGS